jgi:hypothetical protein
MGDKLVIKSGYNKFFLGFLFIMIDFRLQGVDVLPDIIGFILFAVGFNMLAAYSKFFKKAGSFNIIMIIISIFHIYEQPTQGSGLHVNPFGMIIGILSLLLSLAVVYHLFLGIKEMAQSQGKRDIYEEAGRRWTQFLILQLAAIFAFVLIIIPPLVIIYIIALLIAAVIITVLIMRFMSKCGEELN